MISVSEGYNTIDLGKYYSIIPSFSDYSIDQYVKKFGGKKVKNKFSYNSLDNDNYLNVQQIRKLIQKI